MTARFLVVHQLWMDGLPNRSLNRTPQARAFPMPRTRPRNARACGVRLNEFCRDPSFQSWPTTRLPIPRSQFDDWESFQLALPRGSEAATIDRPMQRRDAARDLVVVANRWNQAKLPLVMQRLFFRLSVSFLRGVRWLATWLGPASPNHEIDCLRSQGSQPSQPLPRTRLRPAIRRARVPRPKVMDSMH